MQEHGEPSPDLTHWLGKGLETLTERDWLADLEGEEIALRLAATLLKTGQPISLGTPYHIALRKYADAAATGRTDALVSADTAIDVLSDPKAREDLSKTLLATVSKYARTGIPDDFFTVFGSFLVAVDDGLVDASFASDIVVELISQGSHKQLDWLLKVVERHTATIRRVADPDFRGSVQDRVDTRLESLSDSPNDPRVAVLERIRELLIAGNS